MYVEVQIISGNEVLDTFYDDVQQTDDLIVGTIIPEKRFGYSNLKPYRQLRVVHREETTNRDVTEVDHTKIKPMLKLTLEQAA